jgi:hypothetical protein
LLADAVGRIEKTFSQDSNGRVAAGCFSSRSPASWTALSAMRIERSSKKSVRNGKVFKGLHQFCGVLVPEKARWGPHGDHGNVI